ncbi:50S ribosomal protein L2 [Chlorella vulgaris]
MRPLTEEETKVVFEKLHKFIGKNIKALVERGDQPYCLRLQKNRVFYVREDIMRRATNVARDKLVALGTCIGKFTHGGKFRVTIGALDVLAQYAKYKVWVKPSTEMQFLYGNHVLKNGLGRITENTPSYTGVVVYSMSDVPLGFGVTAKSTSECRAADPNAIVVFHQADCGEYLRAEDELHEQAATHLAMLLRKLAAGLRNAPAWQQAVAERLASATLCSTSGRASESPGTNAHAAHCCLYAASPYRRYLSPTCLGMLSRFASSNASGLKAYKPTTPGFRGRVITSRKDLWKGGPFKPLTEGLSRSGGRNSQGIITARHRGGGHRKVYRELDLARGEGTTAAVVQRLEYDPNRTAHIALVKHKDTEPGVALRQQYSYYLAPQGVQEGDVMYSGVDAPILPGNSLPLSAIPVGTAIHNVELRPGQGGQLGRAAGTSCTLVKKGDDGYAVVKLPSGEQRLVLSRCMATIGVLSNPQNKNVKLGKAGATRWSGRRPRVRGVAMNSVDHPHGGGRGKSKGRISQTPWGKPTKGYRTRSNPRTDWAIRMSRHKAART